MLSSGLMRVCDFEWASVCQYIIYLGAAAGLKEVSMAGINDFPYAAVGGQGLKRRKEKALGVLEFNKARLEAFVEANRDALEDVELSVIRSVYRQLADGEQVVKAHLARIENLLVTECEVQELDFEGGGRK